MVTSQGPTKRKSVRDLGKILLSLSLSASCATASASIYDSAMDARQKALKEAELKLCNPSDEYVKTLKFLRKTKEFTFHEDVSRRIAVQVAKGCDGAAERFAQVLVLLKAVGFSERKSLALALEFADEAPETQKNFVEIFSKSYLAEFFDYEFPRAMQLALDLSRSYRGDPAIARADFIALVKFCKGSSSLDLPMKFCSEYAEKIAKLSQHFADGVEKPFANLFRDLREKKELNLDVKAALTLSHDILKHGPKAPQNFFDAYQFAVKDHELARAPALELALKIASRAHVAEAPPVMQFPTPALPGDLKSLKLEK